MRGLCVLAIWGGLLTWGCKAGGGAAGGAGDSGADSAVRDAAPDVARRDASDAAPRPDASDAAPDAARDEADAARDEADADAGPVPPEDAGGEVICPLPPGDGEPRWCPDLVDRFNTKDLRDLDGDGQDDFWGLRAYRLNRQTLVTQNPALPRSLDDEAFPADCRFALLVPHGGGIETGTEQLGRAVLMRLPHEVANKVGLWVVGGRSAVANLCSTCAPPGCPEDCHHVRSAAIEPECGAQARLAHTLRNCPAGLVLHGQDYSDADFSQILVVGGGNADLRAQLLGRLRAESGAGHFEEDFPVVGADAIPADHPAAGLRGLHPCNIANRFGPRFDAPGVQLELPPSVRQPGEALTRNPSDPLYFYRHETQSPVGDSALLAEILARFVCEQAGGGDACHR